MSKTLLRKISLYLTDEESEKVDKYRGPIPASRIGVIAVRKLLEDLDKGKVDLLKEKGVVSRNNDK